MLLVLLTTSLWLTSARKKRTASISTRNMKHAVHRNSTPLMRRMIFSRLARRSGSHLHTAHINHPLLLGQL